MTCLNCDSLQCVTVNRESYSWLIVAYCSQSPTFICPIVSFASRNTLLALCTCVLKQEISLTVPLGLQKKEKEKPFILRHRGVITYSWKSFLISRGKKRRKEEKEIKKKKRWISSEKRNDPKRFKSERLYAIIDSMKSSCSWLAEFHQFTAISPHHRTINRFK